MKDLRGKRALVTGAASGIGRCIALALAREGVALFLTDRDQAGLDAVSREAGAEGVAVETALCDLTDRAAISAMLSRVSPGLYEWRRRGGWKSRERVLPRSEGR